MLNGESGYAGSETLNNAFLNVAKLVSVVVVVVVSCVR